MQAFPEIADEDVLLLTGEEYLVDLVWQAEYGRQIEYEYRAIPYQLVYLLRKYGPVIPHGFFVESIREVCGKTEQKPNSNLRISVKLSKEAASALIDEAVGLGLITRLTPTADRRYQLYVLTEEQKQKLHRIRVGKAGASALAAVQAADPKNATAGLTEDNKAWYGNFMADMVMRQDAVYEKNKAELGKLNYLLASLLVFAMGASFVLFSLAEAAATIAGGTH
jgi:DNA-binding MarR family transcriptional regulator